MKIHGQVVHGAKIGSSLGYPTANIAVPGDLATADGVYAARVSGEGLAGSYNAMAYLGIKPTFSSGRSNRVLELHLFDFEGNLYGRRLEVELIRFIRPDRKFADSQALRAGIEHDEKTVKQIFWELEH